MEVGLYFVMYSEEMRQKKTERKRRGNSSEAKGPRILSFGCQKKNGRYSHDLRTSKRVFIGNERSSRHADQSTETSL